MKTKEEIKDRIIQLHEGLQKIDNHDNFVALRELKWVIEAKGEDE